MNYLVNFLLTSPSGGTYLRVGFIELVDHEPGEARQSDTAASGTVGAPPIQRLLEKSWAIGEPLKTKNEESLFAWIGQCIASVVKEGCDTFGIDPTVDLPMGVTFSFPMIQRSLSEATVMPMGKGFAFSSHLDLASQLLKGYETARVDGLPRIRIAAIANDAVSTLVSFIYQVPTAENQKAVMGLICGTGSNATIPLKLSSLHPEKRPAAVSVLPGQNGDDVRIAVNTEWSINGSAAPLRKLGLISHWDTELDEAGEMPGFQPLEYMTAGRYLGELGRLILVDYMTSILHIPEDTLPSKMRIRFGLTTTFLSHYRPPAKGTLLDKLENEFPLENEKTPFQWSDDIAEALYRIARAIELRAAGIIAAAIIGLLNCAEEIPLRDKPGVSQRGDTPKELVVGYTGGCISHFQDYLQHCQAFLDTILNLEPGFAPIRVVLSPCHDGGITGAGILVPAALASHRTS